MGVAELCRKYGMSDCTYYNWKAKYSGLTVSDLRKLRQLKEENGKLKRMDFLSDALADGRKIKVLPIVDDYTHKCHAIEVDTSINGRRVCEVLNRIAMFSGLPEVITIDNGPEFIGKALDAWAYQRGIKLRFIHPGKPVENAYIESFNGKFRDECLNENWFTSLDHARRTIEAWLIDYNNQRPHSSLNYMTPEEFLRQETALNETKNSFL
ncbi:MAG: IS3 family transposase [Candidatus Omnitrophica bacterium]|nr:IS3 family transposase [Candidatus Omnitrophota bacterium]